MKNLSQEKIYCFEAEADLTPSLEEALSIIKSKPLDPETEENKETYEYILKKQQYNSLLSDPKLNPLKIWIQKCIDDTLANLGFKEKLEITHSWGTIIDKLEFAERHTHKYSIMSGILILENNGLKNIFFRYPKAVWYRQFLNQGGEFNYHLEDPSPGKLFLFPSSVPHGTVVGNHDGLDILSTISFNTFLKDFDNDRANYKRIKNSI